MTTKIIEGILENCMFINDYEVNLNEGNSKYVVDINFITPRDSDDMSRILLLKNKIRQQVNRAYKVEFIIRFMA